jgi:hypothetical protein
MTNHRLALAATLLLAATAPAGAQFLQAPRNVAPTPVPSPLAPPQPDAGMAFTQRNIPAEATAADAVQAKERAFIIGRRIAWQQLAGQSGLGAANLTDAQIDDLVSSIIVESERVTPRGYAGRITVNFAPDRVRALLAGRAPAGPAPVLSGAALPATPASGHIEATATYRNMTEWLELRRRLLASAPVASLEVQTIAVDAARLRLGLRGSPSEAAGALAAAGVALQPGTGQVPGDAWRLGLGSGG